jgi:DNA (cytosine-5)-methyltransferase 1
MSAAYYNEFEPYAAQWLRNLIGAGLIAPGEVDERSIADVKPDDLVGFSQCHFFAGLGGWSYAARLAGWPDDRPLWTGSCPCQPFSAAGKGEGQKDERHLWPEQFRLIAARRPVVWMGEQVAAAVGKSWLDGVCSDLEGIGYAVGSAVVPACAVDAPHRRDRLWIVADAMCAGWAEGRAVSGAGPTAGHGGTYNGYVADADAGGRVARVWDGSPPRYGNSAASARGSDGGDVDNAVGAGLEGQPRHGANRSQWALASGSTAEASGAIWATGADGKARRIEPSIRLLAHGVPARVGRLRAYGNAIVPQVAAEVIGAFMDCRP